MLEVIVLGLVALVSGVAVRSVIGRRTARRAAHFERGDRVAIPCRIAWRSGLGRGAFVYGKLTSDGDGAVFTRPARRPVRLPVGGRAVRRAAWRPGMQVFEYSSPGGEELRLQVYNGDSERVARYLQMRDVTES
ncbi:hypothetical protein [Streptomyces lannensis]|uniref:hypothetical protein n=1 Tax=Streptomyces lannensis TaxID=766498 RepID=UPI0031E8869F